MFIKEYPISWLINFKHSFYLSIDWQKQSLMFWSMLLQEPIQNILVGCILRQRKTMKLCNILNTALCQTSYILWLNGDKHIHVVVERTFILLRKVVYMRVLFLYTIKKKCLYIVPCKTLVGVIALCSVGLHTCHYAALYGRILVQYRPSDKLWQASQADLNTTSSVHLKSRQNPTVLS